MRALVHSRVVSYHEMPNAIISIDRQTRPQVHVYELTHPEDNYDLRYRLRDKIYIPSSRLLTAPSPITALTKRTDEAKEDSKRVSAMDGSSWARDGDGTSYTGVSCERREIDQTASFLLVTWSNIILCEGNVLQLYDFAGIKVRGTANSSSPYSSSKNDPTVRFHHNDSRPSRKLFVSHYN